MKDELRSVGHGGPSGRGNKSVSPSAAARSLAPKGSRSGPQKGASAASESAASEKKAPRSKPRSAARSHLHAVPEETPRQDQKPTAAPHEDTDASQTAEPSSPADDDTPHQDPLHLEDILAAVVNASQRVLGADWERHLATLISRVRRRLNGDYEVDEFGLDPQILDIVNLAIEPLADKWFRLDVRGIENIPTDGGALLVGNHSGTIPIDGLITGYAVRQHTGRPLRPLGADLMFALPWVSEIARKMGATLACAEDAERLLSTGELAAVWPEGFKGVGKPFSERYKLQRFGRGGFVSSALRAQVPIIPVSIVGAEEIYPLVGNIPSLARLLGIPYVPITPFFPALGPLGLIPLPSKWIIEFGEPIRTDAYPPESADDPMLLFNVTDQVRETIQETLYRLLVERGNPFL